MEQSKRDHECAACGGSGEKQQTDWCPSCTGFDQECSQCGGIGVLDDEGAAGDRRWETYEATGNWDHLEPAKCPVCLGSRRISDVMPARDAVADAETLRQAWKDCRGDWDIPARFHLEEVTTALGRRVDLVPVSARAAFHAVPGLRGS